MALVLTFGLGLESSAKKKDTRTPECTEFVNYLDSYSKTEGCKVMEMGKFWMGMLRKMAEKQAVTEEDKAAVKFIEGLQAMIMAVCSEASQEVKDSFNSGLRVHLDRMSLIMDDVQEGVHCYVYGKMSPDSMTVENMVMHIPEEAVLICFEGIMDANEIKNAIVFDTAEE